jgi:hypothetical protein
MTKRKDSEITTKREQAPPEVRKAYEEMLRDRRQTVRARVSLPVEVEAPSGAGSGETARAEDIGEGGIRLATARPYEVGTPLRVRVAHPAAGDLSLQGTVVWRREGAAVGVRFDSVGEKEKAGIRALIGAR